MGKWRYGIVLDAGSSGTRIHTYKWLKPDKARKKATKEELANLPKVEGIDVKKIHPGISTFGDKPEDVGPDHLHQLFDHAYTVVPEDEIEDTPVFLLATAGMRLLENSKRKTLLKEICTYAKKTTKFQLPDCDLHIQVIPGETEGLYGWIAANYLLQGFDKPDAHDHGKDHHTYGFLDMGGASAQIAFAPNATEAEKHANDLKLLRLRNVDGTSTEYRVFVTTWLGFGVNEARKRYVEHLLEAMPDSDELPDPCLPSGLTVTTKGRPVEAGSPEDKGEKTHISGTGKFDTCIQSVYPLLDKDAPCADPPCLLHGSHVPAIDFDVNHFIGVSEYWHTTHEIFEFAHKDKAYDFHTYQKRVNEFCSMSWSDISKGVKDHAWGNKVDETTALEVCFKASWLINVLHDGIGVPRIGHEALHGGFNGTKEVIDKAKDRGYLDYFQAINKIKGVEVSWTLGKMVLYASSEVSPADPDVLAVGFGTNEPGKGVSSDFQYAGGSPLRWSDDTSPDDDDNDWHDVFTHDSPRRIPGFFLIALIILVALIMACGRERRSSFMHRMRRAFPGGTRSKAAGKRRSKPLNLKLNIASKLFGSNTPPGPAYERVLEEGSASTGGADAFELPDMDDSYTDADHSDSSEGSMRVGRTSGWATPQISGTSGWVTPQISGTNSKSFSDMPAYFDAPASAQVVGLGIGSVHPSGPPSVVGNAIARGGLMARVDSRERLSLDADTAPAHGLRGKMGRVASSKSRASSPSKLRSLKESVD
ncbi:hypothetical protein EJ05DRAFT_479599 [Pseudovirgaria hyperparasitica]|uniref:Nucleoside diphosphatase n=1 Tax=Pseudovirgaria hyperparasitica TaxID=470096 RepID=A0A6A6VY94_9PEZI|nr:uncharacterized protein EJ05DRAFT_479599 [Pseudovirgaria hyperparasitica]KAF2754630.1 hypothetical protein EJ05DRAFT_479599 [Pseudovirgaria hyperparasitica]